MTPARDKMVGLLKKYNQDTFHLRHAVTVEGVMGYFADQLGYGEDRDFWQAVGLLHDIDFEKYPDAHCKKAPELLREIDAPEELIRAVVSHGYGIVVDVEPKHEMEKVLYATDELTGLIYAYALMRPSRSVQGMKLKSLKKKYKSKTFVEGVDRAVIERGAELLGWDLAELITRTIEVMEATEDEVERELLELTRGN